MVLQLVAELRGKIHGPWVTGGDLSGGIAAGELRSGPATQWNRIRGYGKIPGEVEAEADVVVKTVLLKSTPWRHKIKNSLPRAAFRHRMVVLNA